MNPSPFTLAADILDPPPPEYADPTAFIEQKLGVFLWSKQKEILSAVKKHQRVAVPSCYASSKSFTAAQLALAWIETHPAGEALVVTTATTFRQVRGILWKEMRRGHARGKLAGRMNQTEWQKDIFGVEEVVAFGVKPADYDPAAFQGHHARHVLVLVDEADGISEDLYDAAEGLITNRHCRLLAIGNPWDPLGTFAKVCKPGSEWHVIRISAFDTPGFTKESVPEYLIDLLIGPEWVADKQKRWGKDDPRYVSKVLAHFPKDTENTLIHLIWYEEAQKRAVRKSLPIEFGVDVGAGNGGDESVISIRRGNWVRTLYRTASKDTVQFGVEVMRQADELGPRSIKIDSTGVGKGVYDTLRHAHYPVIGVQNGESPRDPDFADLGSELAWHYRSLYLDNEIDIESEQDPDSDEKMTQTVRRKWERTSKGKIRLESKKQMKSRGLPSPDLFDADVLACAPLGVPKPSEEASTNGHRSEFSGILDESRVGF